MIETIFDMAEAILAVGMGTANKLEKRKVKKKNWNLKKGNKDFKQCTTAQLRHTIPVLAMW